MSESQLSHVPTKPRVLGLALLGAMLSAIALPAIFLCIAFGHELGVPTIGFAGLSLLLLVLLHFIKGIISRLNEFPEFKAATLSPRAKQIGIVALIVSLAGVIGVTGELVVGSDRPGRTALLLGEVGVIFAGNAVLAAGLIARSVRAERGRYNIPSTQKTE